MKTIKLLLATSFAATLVSASGLASAQDKAGYWTNSASGNMVWKNSTGLCWRAGYWSPAMAIAECDPDLVPKAPAPVPAAPARPAPAPAAPVPAPAPKPAAAPAPKPPVIKAIVIFGSNGAKLDKQAEFRIDTDVVAKLPAMGTLKYMNVSGHADRLGSPQYNQKLSERRANAVKAYLVKKGVDASKIETFGFGKTSPVKSCPDQKNRKALIACLEPNRRVEIEAEGTLKK
ncbi:MAG: OmpA family protein [Betaproteobacteria bacterium]|nr:OmpA family protein [Betaproteobacteria bacterium]